MAGIWDSILDYAGKASDWYGRNEKWVDKAVNAASNFYSAQNKSNERNGMLDAYKGMIDQNHQQYLAEQDAVKQYNDQYYQYLQGQQAAAASAAAARAAAARQTEANRQAAAKKANKSLNKTFNQVKEFYQPYKETGDRLLPVMEQTYQTGLDGMGLLAAYMLNPERMKRLDNGSKSASEQNIPLPDWAK